MSSRRTPTHADIAAGRRACPVCGSDGERLPGYGSVDLERCDGCGLVFCGREQGELRGHYVSDEYADAHLDHFEQDPAFAYIAEQRLRWLAGRAPARGPLLELGPGRGFFLAATPEAGFEPLGLEPSPGLAARAEEEFGVAVACGFLDEVPLPERHFDAICMFHVFEHVADPLSTLTTLRNLLSDRGRLFIEVPNFASAMSLSRGSAWEAVQPRELHVSQFTPETLRGAVARAGLETLELGTVSPWHYIRPGQRLRPRALAGYAYRAARLGTIRSAHRHGFDNLRLVAARSAGGTTESPAALS